MKEEPGEEGGVVEVNAGLVEDFEDGFFQKHDLGLVLGREVAGHGEGFVVEGMEVAFEGQGLESDLELGEGGEPVLEPSVVDLGAVIVEVDLAVEVVGFGLTAVAGGEVLEGLAGCVDELHVGEFVVGIVGAWEPAG